MHDRRSVLRLAALGMSAAMVSACSRPAPPAAGGPPRGGGTLTYATGVESEGWDPHVASTDVTGLLLRGVFDSLVVQRQDGTFAPWLARSWQVSPDGLRYSFELRDDVTFSDGTPFDAEAVRLNFDRIVAPETASRRAAGLLGPYAGTEVLGPHSLVVHFERPHSSFLSAASTTFLGFHSPRTVHEHPDDLASGGPFTVSTGPFVFSAVQAGRRATFRRREDYWWGPETAAHQGPAYLDQLVVEIVTEDSSRTGAVLSGQVDVADQIPAERLPAVRAHQTVDLVRSVSPGSPYTFFPNTEHPPFDELEVRRAVQAAIDVDAVTRGVFLGEYERAWSPLTPATPGYDPSLESSWPHDPVLAGKLLDRAGFTGRDAQGYRTRGGKRLSVEMPYVQSFVSAKNQTVNIGVQDELRRVGVELVLVPLDSAASMRRTRTGEYGMFAFSWGGGDSGALRNLFHSAKQFADGGANGGRVHDPVLDRWLDEIDATTDLGRIAELQRLVQRRVVEQAYAVPIYVSPRDSAVSRRVGGLTFDVHSWPNFYDTWVSDD
ncbi:ABC transporter substrate-binding protein [Saccharopolyspora hordei]|uniref:Peptide/nickel transport system substrate-binding protein n=1 Tax=Saccharopolyspora hordei TaxID=1838 RepID=A0A853APB8_9PSEU|nr:ABC transporter substrate-binding protein [Saccharopolyspora hordei]NYI84303.1 peptide/nickel transport system substrate-binding protein [Saccharopolyspora hordei]